LKLRIVTLLAVCLTMGAIPAMADYIYNNGGTTGTADGWTINFGFAVTDSFVLPASDAATGASFIFWLSPGDTAPIVDLSIGTSAFGSDVANFTGLVPTGATSLGTNQYGFTVEQDFYSFASTRLSAGTTYWITLQNASVPSGDPVYWDENSGPSMAQENTLGTIPSESFTLLGNSTSTGEATPEPTSILLFGSGLLALAGFVRRKLF
jgi:hypothetical protein